MKDDTPGNSGCGGPPHTQLMRSFKGLGKQPESKRQNVVYTPLVYKIKKDPNLDKSVTEKNRVTSPAVKAHVSTSSKDSKKQQRMLGRAVATYQIYISNHQQRKFVGEVLRDKTLDGLKKALFRRERDNKGITYKTEGRKLVL
ncbi:hypothetical protein TNCT_513401 [Trichonephila clavata]|uniref:Uncharacterized protein n=1 Tax=Trichonephila clavata TaxID=2740835 RepID=A0A8X6JAL5_TRICU|nr:hypothetical protein TNCT_513401 [Trichonephila clavata]